MEHLASIYQSYKEKSIFSYVKVLLKIRLLQLVPELEDIPEKSWDKFIENLQTT